MAASVVVLGGTNSDILAHPGSVNLNLRTSNPGRVTISPGGVGRNIAESLSRLEVPVTLLSAVSGDGLGDEVLRRTAAAGVQCGSVVRGAPEESGMYVAFHDTRGDLHVAVSDMRVMERCDEQYILEKRRLIETAAYLVVDANVPLPTARRAISLAAEAGVPVILEPVSVAKAGALSALEATAFLATPNRDEVSPLLGGALEVDELLVTRGALGVGWVSRGSNRCDLFPEVPRLEGWTNGAGDAFLAGVVAALFRGLPSAEAIRWGMGAARLTLGTPETTYTGMSVALLREEMEHANTDQG